MKPDIEALTESHAQAPLGYTQVADLLIYAKRLEAIAGIARDGDGWLRWIESGGGWRDGFKHWKAEFDAALATLDKERSAQ